MTKEREKGRESDVQLVQSFLSSVRRPLEYQVTLKGREKRNLNLDNKKKTAKCLLTNAIVEGSTNAMEN
jgi:hypothetical protein